jgi:hypothetical protein
MVDFFSNENRAEAKVLRSWKEHHLKSMLDGKIMTYRISRGISNTGA